VKLLEDRSSRSHPSSYLPHVPRSPSLSDQMSAAASQVDMPAGAAGIFTEPGSFISASDAAGVDQCIHNYSVGRLKNVATNLATGAEGC
jgi:hypothetical protein